VIALLYISWKVYRWKNFENRLVYYLMKLCKKNLGGVLFWPTVYIFSYKLSCIKRCMYLKAIESILNEEQSARRITLNNRITIAQRTCAQSYIPPFYRRNYLYLCKYMIKKLCHTSLRFCNKTKFVGYWVITLSWSFIWPFVQGRFWH